ncbi:hypothetical protein FSARC_7637 [Fusarium sarcochroum]|uniref:Glycosyltransferase family 28 N-terminal domain-containing protein n=1 Tax=Fusarium sarcochroum TaxID=1208366 RepID=A0A8H4TUU3_9HYPO|nr:hypothetical protein FSARC_7637 [Fusarium sarcochroum]
MKEFYASTVITPPYYTLTLLKLGACEAGQASTGPVFRQGTATPLIFQDSWLLFVVIAPHILVKDAKAFLATYQTSSTNYTCLGWNKNDRPSISEPPPMDTPPTADGPPRYSSIYELVGDSVHLQVSHRRRLLDKESEAPIPVWTEQEQDAPIPVLVEQGPEAPIPVWTEQEPERERPIPVYTEREQKPIRLNIVIQVVGSRGDVQPFVALGCELRKHGHRVRLATHGIFRDFIRKAGLDFFSIGGNPTELMAYMVKNPGLIPSIESLRAGDIQAKQKMMKEILRGCWSSCVSPDPITMEPFVADAIIANPPSFAHIHCAQALGIPVHLMFTMPWTSTREFSHPLASIINNKGSQTSTRKTANYLSYLAVEWMTWQGLGDIINKWRGSMGLEGVDFSEGPLMAETLKVPFTYCWSPSLVPKPKDWGPHIDVCGFFFRESPGYQPEAGLDAFLRGGDRPVYIGFGSIVIEEPAKLTKMILESVKSAGVRAIISKGWSNLGDECSDDPTIFFLDDCPHEWLFQRVSAVVHHGGAGTTACGLLNGRPTAIVPFFGDQPFWGDMVAAAGAVPTPIPYRELDVDKLTQALRFCLTKEASSAARGIAERMSSESGVQRAVAGFHANLPLTTMRCDILSDRPATWLLKKKGHDIKLSKEASGILIREGHLVWKDLKRYDTKKTVIDLRRLEPITATTSSLVTVGSGMIGSAIDIVAKPIQAYKIASDGASSSDSKPTQQASSTTGRPVAVAIPADGVITTEVPSAFKTAVQGSAAGAGGVLKHFTKGMLDAPLAVAEGFRNAPRLYGGKVYEPGRIDGFVSGGIVAGKNLGHGLLEGFGGLVMSPVRGARSDGAVGLAKGFGVGCLNMSTKVPSGLLGLIFYPGQGAYKSIHTATHRKTRNDLKSARQVESDRLAEQAFKGRDKVLRHFEIWVNHASDSKRVLQHPKTWFDK